MIIVKSQIEKKLADLHPNILRKDINLILEIVLSEITEALYRNETIEIRGFGRFSTKIRKHRIGRNPKNGNAVDIPEKKVVKWKCSKLLLDKLNKNSTENQAFNTY